MTTTRGGKDPQDLFVTPDWTIDAVLSELPISGVVLDPGCGDGAILARIAAQTDRCYLVGVEIDPARAATARERVKEIGRAHV